MYEVTFSLDGLIRKMVVNAKDSTQAMQILTNMYSHMTKVQIINVRKI